MLRAQVAVWTKICRVGLWYCATMMLCWYLERGAQLRRFWIVGHRLCVRGQSLRKLHEVQQPRKETVLP